VNRPNPHVVEDLELLVFAEADDERLDELVEGRAAADDERFAGLGVGEGVHVERGLFEALQDVCVEVPEDFRDVSVRDVVDDQLGLWVSCGYWTRASAAVP